MLWSKFKNLKLGLKIIVGIIAIIFLPITLLLFAIELLVRSIKNRKTLGIIISGILTIALLFFSGMHIYLMYAVATTDPAEVALEQEQMEKEEQEVNKKAEQEAEQEANKKAAETLPVKPVEYNSIDELKEAYDSKLNDIMDGKQVQKLDKDKIKSDDVINIAKSSKNLIKQADSNTEKVNLSGYLVSVDDLSHNTTDTVKSEIYDYIVSEYKDNKLKDKDKFYEYLYLTRYLDKSLEDSDERSSTVFDMYQIVKDNYRGLDTEENESQVNKALGIKTTQTSKSTKSNSNNTSTKSSSKKSTSNKNTNSSSNDIIVYANGGSSSSNKYHSSPNAHGMKGAIKMTEKEAKASGYVPCKRCY